MPNCSFIDYVISTQDSFMAVKNQTNQTNQTVQNHLDYLIFVSWDCMQNFSFLGYV